MNKVDKKISGYKIIETDKTLRRKKIAARIYEYRYFYLMFLPVFVFAIVFFYVPMIGLVLSFTKYTGIRAPVFVGLDNFTKMFGLKNFWLAFRNTLEISVTKLLLNTVMAVILSLLLNEFQNLNAKKFFQTVVYLPHFLSWVVTASLFAMLLSPQDTGLVNQLLIKLGIISSDKTIYFLGNQNTWRGAYFFINAWKDSGWGTIIFVATLAGISPQLYEAAQIDGANRWQRMKAITLPALSTTIIIVLVLNLAKVLNLFESAFVMQNDAVMGTANVLQTYIYYQTFNSGSIPNYGYTIAVGLFKSIVGCILVLACNFISKKVRDDGRGIV